MTRVIEHCMGTVFSFELRDPLPAEVVENALAELHHVDEVFSPFRSNSDISRLARGETMIEDCDPEVAAVLARADELRIRTNGYFDIMASGQLDPCGLVKGWAIETIDRRLRQAGSTRHAINGGGDIRCTGAKAPGEPWRFGIVDPADHRTILTVVAGTDFALATSGTAERGQHILDPHTGRPPQGLAGVSVVGRDLAMVDAFATAAFAMGVDARNWLDAQPDVEAFVVADDGTTWATAGLWSLPATAVR